MLNIGISRIVGGIMCISSVVMEIVLWFMNWNCISV